MSRDKKLRRFAREYLSTYDGEVLDLDEAARWIRDTGRYECAPITPHQQVKQELARALRSAKFMDEEGNEIRLAHPIRLKKGDQQQQVLWSFIEDAQPKHMRLSLQQRRQGILANCHQHSLDTNWYNRHNKFGAQLPLFDYDFNKDLEEKNMPTDYPESAPDFDFDDEDDENGE